MPPWQPRTVTEAPAGLAAPPARSAEALAAGAALPPQGLLGLLRRNLSRSEFFAGLFLICCVNGLGARAVDAVATDGWAEALAGTFGISIVVWAACLAGLSLALQAPSGRITHGDVAVGAACLGLAALPIGALSWVALTAASLFAIGRFEPGSPHRRGALILLAVTIPLCWSRLLFALLSPWILAADAVLVSLVVGTERIGNTVRFAGGEDFFQIYPACSSLTNMSLAVLSWVTISQLLRHRWSPRDLAWCGLACLSVVAVNVLRISLIGLNREHFELIHGPIGAAAANWTSLALMVGLCVVGVRHELSRS